MYEVFVDTLTMEGPADTSRLSRLFDEGGRDPAQVVAIIAQTEGDGHARGYCSMAIRLMLADRLGMTAEAIGDRIPMLMIGGTAGLMSPHLTVFSRKPVERPLDPGAGRALAVGTATSAPLALSELGTLAQVSAARTAVLAAMEDAGFDDPDDVVCVEIKCPNGDGTNAETGPRSRGASALGAALALGEIEPDAIGTQSIGRDCRLHSKKASASSGTELVDIKVLVIGNRRGVPGELIAGGSVMSDALDVAGAQEAFAAAGLAPVDGTLSPSQTARIASVFVNAGADYLPSCRGLRHTMRTDALSSYSGHLAKAIVHAQVSAIAGTTLVLANAGAEHQGPPGGNLVCVIARSAGESR